MQIKGPMTGHGAFAVGFLLLAIHFSWPPIVQATHRPPAGTVAMPPAPGVLTFRGGDLPFENPGAANDGIHWGGRTDFNAACEGLIRQTLGVLNARGAPVLIPNAQRIRVGGNGGVVLDKAQNIRAGGAGGVVIGFTDPNQQRRAFNIDVTTFAIAFRTLRAGDTLYMCGHGGKADNGNQGGVILLDSGIRFNGFASANFPDGTDAGPGPDPKRPRQPYPALPPVPATGPVVRAHLHHCFSGRDPDGAGSEKMQAVSTTLDAGVAIEHFHLNAARTTQDATFVGGTQAQKLAAQAELAQKWQPIVKTLRYPERYARGQALIDALLGAGVVALDLTYGDTGDVPTVDPPDEILTDSGCLEVNVIPRSLARVEIRGPFGTEVITLSSRTETQADLETLTVETDGRESVETKIVELQLTGTSKFLGPVTLRLREPHKPPFQASGGRIKETVQIKPGRLDVAPFCSASADSACSGSTAESFFDVFFEFEALGITHHAEIPKRLRATITSDPPAEGETHQGLDTILLVDEGGNPTGIELGATFVTFKPTLSPIASFAGTVTRVGEVKDGGQVRISGKVPIDGPIDLGASTVTLHNVVNASGRELVNGSAGASTLPFHLAARAGSTRNAAIFETASGARPSFYVELKNRDPGKSPLEFLVKVDRTSIPAAPLCDGAPPSTELLTSFVVNDGVNPTLVIATENIWRCTGTDPLRPSSLRTP